MADCKDQEFAMLQMEEEEEGEEEGEEEEEEHIREVAED